MRGDQSIIIHFLPDANYFRSRVPAYDGEIFVCAPALNDVIAEK